MILLEGFSKCSSEIRSLYTFSVLDDDFQLWRVLEEVQQEKEAIATYGDGA